MLHESVRPLLRFLGYALAFMVAALGLWIPRTFGDVTLDQVLWHLRYAEQAAMDMGEVFLVEFVVEVLLVPCALAVLATALHSRLALRLSGWPRLTLRTVPTAALVVAAGALGLQFSVLSYASAYLGPDRFAENFVDPGQVRMQQQQRRNLVLIYAESLEATYGDSQLFGSDLLAATRRVGGHSYAHYRPMPGATWTMAGIVATQCGVPLIVYSEGDARTFLPGATCLGDVLHARGYRNVFLGGASLSFAGKGRFLRDHGYAETWGREEWRKAGVQLGEMNAFGLYDDALFERAQSRLAQLHAAGQPFNLTLLTLDTHNPFGFMSNACRRRGAADFGGIVRCASSQIAEFIEFARARGYLQDTVIVVIGDHLAVPNPLYDKLEQAGARRGMFNLIVGEKLPRPNTDELLPVDMFPTLLELVGMEVQGDRLALGYSAVGAADVARPTGRAEGWSPGALRGSPLYDALWRVPARAARRD